MSKPESSSKKMPSTPDEAQMILFARIRRLLTRVMPIVMTTMIISYMASFALSQPATEVLCNLMNSDNIGCSVQESGGFPFSVIIGAALAFTFCLAVVLTFVAVAIFSAIVADLLTIGKIERSK